ncbi:nSTAND1 domain-containing NTPase [Geodermatophilus sp. URMC 60]
MTAGSPAAGPAAADRDRREIFLSYVAEDRDWAEGFLLPGLRQASVRVGIESEFRLGRPLSEQFAEAVERSERVVLVISPAFLADDSALRLRLLAQHYGLEHSTWPVLPILLHPVDKLPLSLAMLTTLDATHEADWEVCLARLLADLHREVAAEVAPPGCPYPGMVPYTSEQSRQFHGRAAEIEEVVERVRLHPVLAVVGPSGCGKSSLLQAGVVPRLAAGGARIITVRPGDRPHDTLLTALASAERPGPEEATVLVVDQLEELFTHAAPGAGGQVIDFCRKLRSLCESGRVRCLLAIRADFYPQLMTSPLWATVRDHRLEVLPLTGDRLREAIAAPAAEVGVHIEAALVQTIVHDAGGQPGSLPLIQETLVLLWGRLRRRYLPISAYDALVLPSSSYGEPPRTGLQVALARRADAAMAALATDEERLLARRVFLRLVQLMDGRGDVRRQQRRRDLESPDSSAETFDRVLQHLIDARLVTCSTDERTSDPGEALIDLAHEAIITGWPALRGWIADLRAAERTRRHLEDAAASWVRLGRGAGGLMDDVELGQARAWLDGPDADELGASRDLLDLVTASDAALATARARKARLDRLFRLLTVALAALLAAVVVVAVVAVQQRNEARDGRVLARSGELALAAAALLPEQVDRALLLSQEGLRLRSTPRTVGGALAALAANPRVLRVLHAPVPQYAVAVVGERQAAVTGGLDGVVRSWNLDGGAPGELGRLGGEIRSIAVRPDGGAVVATSSTGEIGQWTLPGGEPVPFLSGPQAGPEHVGSVRTAAYSPDGTLLATGGQDGQVILRDARTGQGQRLLTGYADWVNTVAFTPDGATLLAGGGRTGGDPDDRRILAWDVATGALRAELLGHTGAVRALAVGPDGALLASAGEEGAVRIWSLASGQLVHELPGHEERAFDVAFSPDGDRLASASRDHTVRLWDPATGQAVGDPLRGHGDYVRGLGFLANDQMLSVGGTRLFLWDTGNAGRSRLATSLPEQSAPSRAVAVDRSGERVATGEDSGRIVLRTADGIPTGIELDAVDPVSSLAFGPGSMLVSATYSGRVRVWDAADGRARTDELGLGEGSVVVEVSPDGRYVVTGGDGGLVRAWDPVLREVSTLGRHDNWVRDLVFRPSDGALISAGADGRARLWPDFPAPESLTLTERTSRMETAAVSPDGETVAIGNAEGEVVLWDLAETDARRADRPALAGHEGTVTGIAYLEPAGRLATADETGTLRLWEADVRLDPLGELGRLDRVGGVVALPSGAAVFSAGDGGVIRWTLDLGEWRDLACAVAGRELSDAEADRYGLSRPPQTCAGTPGG